MQLWVMVKQSYKALPSVSGAEPEVCGAGIAKEDEQSGKEQRPARIYVCLLLSLGLQISQCGYLQEKLHTLAWDAETLKDSEMLVGGPAAAHKPQQHLMPCLILRTGSAWLGFTSPCTWRTGFL